MTDADFLRFICDEPENMTPRLMYADWLIDQGHPRGEFIREQIENPMPENPQSEDSLLRKDWHNFFDNDWKWSDPPAVLIGTKTFSGPDTALFSDKSREIKIVYRRGFVERVYCTIKWWAEYGDSMVKIAPLLKVISIDSEPWDNRSFTLNEEKQWGWQRSHAWHYHSEGYYVPPAAWDLMEGEITKVDVRCYTAKEDAVEDLSYGLLKWARS